MFLNFVVVVVVVRVNYSRTSFKTDIRQDGYLPKTDTFLVSFWRISIEKYGSFRVSRDMVVWKRFCCIC